MRYDCGLLSQLGQRGEIKQGSDMGGEGRDFNKLLQDHSEARSHHETRPLQSLCVIKRRSSNILKENSGHSQS